MTSTKSLAFAFSALAFVLQPAMGQQLITEQSTSITNLRYSLIDLAPGDLVAPSVNFPTEQGMLTVYEFVSPPEPTEIIDEKAFVSTFPSASSETLTGLNGHASAVSVANGVTVYNKTTVDSANKLIAKIQAYPNYGTQLHTGAEAYSQKDLAAPSESKHFVLSAQTSLVIEGEMAISFLLSQDAQVLQNLASEHNVRFELNTHQYAQAYVHLQGSDGSWGSNPDDMVQVSFNTAAEVDPSGMTYTSDGYGLSGGPGQKGLRLVISNTSNQSREGYFFYIASTSSQLVAGSMTAQVPEPASWASFALGLGFLGAAVVRQRKRHACG